MKKTTNYQLSQWDATDRILREDFNGDNAKIDAAIAAVKQASADAVAEIQRSCPYRTIKRVTTTAAAQQVDLDVRDIDFTQYLQTWIFFRCPNCSTQLVLRVNNATTGYHFGQTSGSVNGGDSSYFMSVRDCAYGTVMLYTAAQDRNVAGISFSIQTSNYGMGVGFQVISPVSWTNFQTLNITGDSGKIPAGMEITIAGVRA